MKTNILFRLVLTLTVFAMAHPNTLVVASSDGIDTGSIPYAVTENLQMLSQIGGATRSVFVQGDFAFIGEGPRLTVLDVSNPISPTIHGQTELLSGVVESVFVSGNYAYVLHSEGLNSVEVSDPANPVVVGFYSNATGSWDIGRGLFVEGNYAYVPAGNAGLRIVDISDPTNLIEVGFYDTPGAARAVYIESGLAYVADTISGLRIIDINNPANPSEIGYYESTHSLDVYVVENFAYLVGKSGLLILDISSPASPMAVGIFNTPNFYPFNGVYVSGDYAYIANGFSFLVVNISNPSDPIQASSITNFFNLNDVFVSGNYAYFTDGYSGVGLHIIDISNSASPLKIGNYFSGGILLDVSASGETVYSSGNDVVLFPVDATDPSNPKKLGFLKDRADMQGIAVKDNYAYVIGSGLRVIDISNPANPIQIASLPLTGNGIYVSGDYVYVAGGNSGMQIVDISNPTGPNLVGSYDTPGVSYGVFVSGNIASIADFESGLRLIDVSNPTNPVEVGFYNTPGEAFDVYVLDQIAYVADGFAGGLRIVDISDPANPVEIGFYISQPGSARDVHVIGNAAYVANLKDLYVLDISDPSDPIETYRFDLADYVHGVHVENNLVYVAAAYSGLFILDTGIQPPVSCEPNDLHPYQWNMRAIDLVGALDQFPNCQAAPVKIAIIDTGVDDQHPELNGRVFSTFTTRGKTAKDQNGHGTFIAGIVGANQNNSFGIAGIHPNADLMIYKFTNNSKNIYDLLSKNQLNYSKLIKKAVDEGARVINLSSGFKTDLLLIIKDAVEYAANHNPPAIIVAGAWESYPVTDNVIYPAYYALTYDNVIAVTASTVNNTFPDIYADPGNYITIAAPGGLAIGDCSPTEDDCILSLWPTIGGEKRLGGYNEGWGTSYAAPHVAGVVALMLSANPNLTPLQIKAILINTSSRFSPPDDGLEYGILNARKAVECAKNPDTILCAGQP